MKKIMLTAAYLFSLSVGFAQWQTDVRLTDDSGDSYTSYSSSRCIVSNGNTLHVAWYDSRDGNEEIYYKRSTDGGATWGSNTRITNDPAASEFPSLSLNGSVVHLFWGDTRNGEDEIYYKRSADAGVTWTDDIRLTNDIYYGSYPSSAVSGDVVHVAWEDARDGNIEIYYKRSDDGGLTWGDDVRLTNDDADSENPSVAISGDYVHVVWNDKRHGETETYYKRSTDGGVTWESDVRLTNDPAHSNLASVGAQGADVHVVWYDERDGNREIYYKHSSDNGATWSADVRITNNAGDSNNPSVTASGSLVHLLWHNEIDDNYEIFYRRSTDGGTTWESETQLTDAAGKSARPSLTLSGESIHIVWYDERDGNSEIYYKQNPDGNSTVGVQNIIGSHLQFIIYPDPATDHFTVAFNHIIHSGFVALYTITGEKICSTIITEAAQVDIQSDNCTNGMYVLKVFDGKLYYSRKMLISNK